MCGLSRAGRSWGLRCAVENFACADTVKQGTSLGISERMVAKVELRPAKNCLNAMAAIRAVVLFAVRKSDMSFMLATEALC